MGGITNIRAFAMSHGPQRWGVRLAGVSGAGAPDGLLGPGFHACDADLEDAGEGRSLRLLAQMPAQREWTRQEVLRRFLGSQ